MPLIRLDYIDTLGGKNEKKVLEFSQELLETPVNRDSLFVIKVDGESMQPLIKDRALVVADLSRKEIEDRGIYLVYKGGRMWIKQASRAPHGMTFVSINEAYSHLVYDVEEVRVVAKALLTFTAL